jgi:hypothetical protein
MAGHSRSWFLRKAEGRDFEPRRLATGASSIWPAWWFGLNCGWIHSWPAASGSRWNDPVPADALLARARVQPLRYERLTASGGTVYVGMSR